MQQTLYSQIIVGISNFLATSVVDIHKFIANFMHSADVSKIAYTYYNPENLTYSHIKNFNPYNFL